MRAVPLTRFDGPEDLEIVDVPEPTPGPGQQLYDVSTAAPTTPTLTTACPDSYLGPGSGVRTPYRACGPVF
jgi:hypothetical protein